MRQKRLREAAEARAAAAAPSPAPTAAAAELAAVAAARAQHERELADARRANAQRRANLLKTHAEELAAAQRGRPGRARDQRIDNIKTRQARMLLHQARRHEERVANMERAFDQREERVSRRARRDADVDPDAPVHLNRMNPTDRHREDYAAKWLRKREDVKKARAAKDAASQARRRQETTDDVRESDEKPGQGNGKSEKGGGGGPDLGAVIWALTWALTWAPSALSYELSG